MSPSMRLQSYYATGCALGANNSVVISSNDLITPSAFSASQMSLVACPSSPVLIALVSSGLWPPKDNSDRVAATWRPTLVRMASKWVEASTAPLMP
jgi:hypothetical protein